MREIKFRAWDKKFDRMVGIGGIQDLFSIRSDGIPSNENYVLMQYTGLLDKTRKEIWEGDRFHFGEDEHICLFQSGCFGWEENGEFYDLRLVYSCVEVIGNIYENPELMKGE